jgi:hypothetical protein
MAAWLGRFDSHDTPISKPLEIRVIGTTGISPNTEVPLAVRISKSNPPMFRIVTGAPVGGGTSA